MPFLEHQHSRLHYRVLGRGSKAMLAFHGYGQTSAYFLPMEQALGEEYTIFAFDLFFHGKSSLRKSNSPLTKEHLHELVGRLLEQEGINRFSLMGYSMGGKFALALVEQMSEKLNELHLIAPDGIQTSFWYNMATYPGWMQQLFKRTVLKPAPFFRFLKVMHRLKLVSKGLLRFARHQMDTRQRRLRVYRSWIGFKYLRFDNKAIIEKLNQQQVPVTVYLGQFDKVIAPKRFEAFVQALDKGKLKVLQTGHTHLLQEVAKLLRQQRTNTSQR
ncbi:alpha/beta hydrolase [Pontibacter qinzhouensis]|uniref:Alpha/beta hydrolase n=1 Tax=Pontibacter qinzhouensis TaxID=2603253 RepID=A0A5C8K9W0_9BACT|nr:alpha/beta hydrolase [Pontibacter qinzhouensis]TXK51582.1 alpha/beta hydrolase [Pontibacter qinzhouensis]